MSANETIAAAMTRVGVGEHRVSVEMTHEQYGSIAAALLLVSIDRHLTPELVAEFATLREQFVSAPIDGLSD